MSKVTPQLVKELRAQTGAGMMDCKSALDEANGSIEGAIEVLRKKGLKDISKRAGKVAAEGTIGVYVHQGEQVVAIVEINCETDFVARSQEFRDLARDIAMHVAAIEPKYLNVEDVPVEVVEKEKEIYIEQLTPAQKSKADQILPGKMASFFKKCVLLEQPFIKDDSEKVTIKNLVDTYSAKCGEKIAVRRFERFEVGAGIVKQQANFVDEVNSLAGTV